jgi:hypothetical protein
MDAPLVSLGSPSVKPIASWCFYYLELGNGMFCQRQWTLHQDKSVAYLVFLSAEGSHGTFRRRLRNELATLDFRI